MTEEELNTEFAKVVEESNFFVAIEKIKNLEKPYKESEFYKKTKMPILDAFKYYKAWYVIDFDTLGKRIQDFINSLDAEKMDNFLGQLGEIYNSENEEIMDQVDKLNKSLKGLTTTNK